MKTKRSDDSLGRKTFRCEVTNPNFNKLRKKDRVFLIIPMPLPYEPIPSGLAHMDLLALILVPMWIIGSSIANAIFKFEVPPRAVFEIDADQFRMNLVSRESGDETFYKFPRQKISELRKNRFEKGLWLRVSGETMTTHLKDLDDEVIVALSKELWKTIREFDNTKAVEKNEAGR